MKYIVIVHTPPSPSREALKGIGTTTIATPPQVKMVEARSPREAAEKADVRSGGHCFVAAYSDVHRFNRAAVAPLDAVTPDGTPLPVAMPA